ncbi:hypothetical protein JVU11DRAFT_5967 [Chiua virens]|nr:hypothetical protein JVU11DRAFT_5967 [Chiua virens]
MMLNESNEEREANFERLWNLAGFNFPFGNYLDTVRDMRANSLAYGFWRKKKSHPIGTKRQSMEQNFHEVLNQENVDLVDLKTTPILEINENGLKATGKEYEFDMLIFATGFDGYVGGFNDIDLRDLNGKTIQDHWKDGVTTYLGMTIDDFPNLFFTYGPHGPTALSNVPTCVQLQGSWIDQTIEYLRDNHITKFTPTSY